jgi:hypothetical protein
MLSCKAIHKYIYSGFTQLVHELHPKMNKIDVILNNEISKLFLYIYDYVEPDIQDNDNIPNTDEQNIKTSEKYIILSIFVKNYPDEELLKLIKTVGLFDKFLKASSDINYLDNSEIYNIFNILKKIYLNINNFNIIYKNINIKEITNKNYINLNGYYIGSDTQMDSIEYNLNIIKDFLLNIFNKFKYDFNIFF